MKGLRERWDSSVLSGLVKQSQGSRRSAAEQLRVNRDAHSLALYQFQNCSYCVKTRAAIAQLNVPISIRDAQTGDFRDELAREGGRIKVPCLRIDHGHFVQWLYESDQIIDYLKQRFA